MPDMTEQPVASFSPVTFPAVAEVDGIAALGHPIIRNLRITQCYYEISTAFMSRTGPVTNWCTFATWASKQAGQTIRKEDLARALELMLKKEPEIEQAARIIALLAKRMGAKQTMEQIRQSVLGILVTAAVERSGEAVSRGNKKVFEEIAREFARFMHLCLADQTFTGDHLDEFCRHLRPGPPPDGQEYLSRAFSRYYASFFEESQQNCTEMRHLANLEIGFHEQTRLQPEIIDSLNAVSIDPEMVKKRLVSLLFNDMDQLSGLHVFLKDRLHSTALLDKPVELLVSRVQYHLRKILTAHLMTLSLPPKIVLRLGQDLSMSYPERLKKPVSGELLALLMRIDPTPDSLRQTGAVDWSDLPERLHFIADLFRCFYESPDLFGPPFTAAQVTDMKAGRIPSGRL
jgi:hypothetical protein